MRLPAPGAPLMPGPKPAHVIDEISYVGVRENEAPTTCSCGWEGTYAAFVDHRANPPKEHPMPKPAGPTLKQQEAWDLVTEGGLTQVEAAQRLGVTQAGVQSRLRGYMDAMGLTGPLPGLGGGNGPIRITRVDPALLDGPTTTSAPDGAASTAEASPSVAPAATVAEDVAAPAPVGSDTGAGSGDPYACTRCGTALLSVDEYASHTCDLLATPEPTAPVRRVEPARVEDLVGASTQRVLYVLEAEVDRLEEVAWRIKSEIEEREGELQRTYPLLTAAQAARDAYRAHVSGGDRA